MSELNESSGSRPQRILFAVLTTLLFALFVFQLVYHAVRASATFDEPNHILAGHRHWCGDFGINPEHPPLLKLLATAPLNFMTLVDEPPWECGSKMTSKADAYRYGTTFLVENGLDTMVITTRVTGSLMSMLLAILVFLAAWEMFGRWEAVTALAILAFEPNLIAYGSQVMTDMAISATSFGAMYALYRYGKKRTWLQFAVAGLAFGLMLGAKHTATIFVGIFFLLLIADMILFRGIETKLPSQVARRVAVFAGIFLIGWVMLWSLYGFRYRAIPNVSAPATSVADYIKENGRPEMVGSFSARVVEAVSYSRLFPESYVLGMADIVALGSRNSNIFGRVYPTGKWFYYPVAFVVKSSIALLLLLPFGLVFGYLNREKLREVMFLLVPAFCFFVVASSSGMSIGSRHILPVYAFTIVLAGAGAVWFSRKLYYFRYFLAALLVYHAAVAARTAPNYIPFSNDFWGGYENTYRILGKDDADFGGSIKQVNEYLSRENINDCWVAAVDLFKYEPPCRAMPSAAALGTGRDLIDPIPPVIDGTVILGVRQIPPEGGDEFAPIAESQPIAFIGGTKFVHRGRFEVPLMAAISHVHRSNYFLRVNDIDQAIAEARQAVELAPVDPRPHLAFGLALVQAGQKEESKHEFEATINLAKSNPRFRSQAVQAQKELDRMNQ